MAAGGSQVPATSNVGDWNAVVGEVRRCLIPETPVNGHRKLVLYSLSSNVTTDFKILNGGSEMSYESLTISLKF